MESSASAACYVERRGGAVTALELKRSDSRIPPGRRCPGGIFATALAAFLLAAFAGGCNHPARIPEPAPIPADITSMPLPAGTVRLIRLDESNSQATKEGSALLIGRDRILTAAHCTPSDSDPANTRGKSAVTIPCPQQLCQRADLFTVHYSLTARFVGPRPMRPVERNEVMARFIENLDYAVAELEPPLPFEAPSCAWLARPLVTGDIVALARPCRPNGPIAANLDPADAVRCFGRVWRTQEFPEGTVTEAVMVGDEFPGPGWSGCPVYVLEDLQGTRAWRLAGVNSANADYPDRERGADAVRTVIRFCTPPSGIQSDLARPH